jgi:LEA14-like dessication related protein
MTGFTRSIVVLNVLLTAALGGCATTEALVSAPQVSLSSVEMKSLSFSGQTFLLHFDVSNPNPFSLPIESVRYHLRLGEPRFASGESQGNFLVPAGSDATFAISVDLDILQQTSQLTSLLRTGTSSDEVDYELQGSLVVDIPFAKPLAFSNSGVISVSGGL